MSQTPEIPGFNLNSPKNYLGYTVAVDVAESLPETDAATLIEKKNQNGKRITRDVSGARNGSRHLGLITANSERDELTDLGQQVAGFGAREYGSKTGALDALRSLYGKDRKFIDELPEWEEITQEVMVGHSGISRLISLMQEIHSDREDDSAFPLPLLAQEVHHRDPDFARKCFFKSDAVDQLNNIDWRAIGADDTTPELYEKTIYRSSIVHQFKSILYHAGILTTRGKTRQDLEFSSDEKRFLWGLTAKFREDSFLLSLEETAKLDQPDIEELVRDIAPPERVEATTSRIIRSTALVKTLKNDYNYRCQVCGARRRQSSESYYAEGHHLRPLGEDGPDLRENIVIVCPTCHADLDYGMMSINPETHEISHCYDEEIDDRTLTVIESHTPNPEYLNYHNQEIVESESIDNRAE